MKIQLEYKDHLVADQCTVYLVSSKSDIASIVSRTETMDYVRKKLLEEQPGFLKLSDNPATPLYLVIAPDENQPYFQYTRAYQKTWSQALERNSGRKNFRNSGKLTSRKP